MSKYIKKKNKKQEDLIKKFDKKKSNNLKIGNFIEQFVSSVGHERFKDCGTYLKLIGNIDLSKKKVIEANYCGNRFCPICTWIKAKKDGYMLSVIMKWINQKHKKEFIFITLTSINVVASELNNEINKFNLGFRKLIMRKEFALINKGYVRKLELTYNKKTNTYNPHFHIIMAVNKSYFNDRSYIKQEKWLENWRECMNDENITQLDVRRAKDNTISEIAKYSAKDSDYLHSEEVFKVFYNALKGRQLLTHNGLFKDGVKLYKSKDKENNLDKYKTMDTTEYLYYLDYLWTSIKYNQEVIRKLTDEEYKDFNKHFTNEIDVDM